MDLRQTNNETALALLLITDKDRLADSIVEAAKDYRQKCDDDTQSREDLTERSFKEGISWFLSRCSIDYVSYKPSHHVPNTRKSVRKNPTVQFELKQTFESDSGMRDAYDWIVNNTPLTAERGVIYQVDEIYIITSSQRIIDKINSHFGSTFNFESGEKFCNTFYL